ncbi:MAG TPA: TetR/AcrR family transcriptional regulator [Kofleriaceae bacterium]|nr:TetR/AcrR family transcriptional regulator [Kofleriaceae bacterium]
MTTTAKTSGTKGSEPTGRKSAANLEAALGGKGERKHAPSDKREAIMQAALDLFVERGFYGTAVPEIADKAGVGAGTIYRYFESKEALVNALYRQEKQRFAERTLMDFPKTTIARELFRTLWMRMSKFAVETPKPFVFLELHHHAPYLDGESTALEQRMLELFSGVVVAAQARGELKAGPPRLLMGLVMGAFVGVIRSCVEIAQPLEDADWVLAEQCVWEAIRA